ncbi:XisH family protein [Roseofilum sp. Guam]|uniref:XisH family protein n=1 Tax=Roseofilum sp. Guam TaxID=2821502 RepID=UPI00298D7CBB|nr:XisH family protein [Roseofilum sp. Guam]
MKQSTTTLTTIDNLTQSTMAKDLFHDVVKNALEKEGWLITDDPLEIRTGGATVKIDLGAEQILAAERDNEKIAVEIKSFLGPSNLYEFHGAVGQFMTYRLALQAKQPERTLYLAVPLDIHQQFFSLPFVQMVVNHYEISLIIYDSVEEVIAEWKK